jgi:hypothetical protein
MIKQNPREKLAKLCRLQKYLGHDSKNLFLLNTTQNILRNVKVSFFYLEVKVI